jgi:t-SNARE complex subunit (syntaxin)
MLDNIESNLGDTQDYMEKTIVDLDKAINYHKKSRTKMCCIVMCILVGLCILLFGVLKVQG